MKEIEIELIVKNNLENEVKAILKLTQIEGFITRISKVKFKKIWLKIRKKFIILILSNIKIIQSVLVCK